MLKCIWQIFFICLIESSCCSRMKIEKNKFAIDFFPLVWGGQRHEISLPGVYKTAQGGRLGIVDLWRQYKIAAFADSLFQCFSLCKGRKMVLRCVVYGCSNTKDVKKVKQNPRKQRSCIDVTGPLSLVSRLARFCTHPEVKFHVFDRLKRGEEKSIANLFFCFSHENNKKIRSSK